MYISFFVVVHMKEDGYKIISEEDCTKLHYKYAEERKWYVFHILLNKTSFVWKCILILAYERYLQIEGRFTWSDALVATKYFWVGDEKPFGTCAKERQTSFTNSSFSLAEINSACFFATNLLQHLNNISMIQGRMKIIPWTIDKSVIVRSSIQSIVKASNQILTNRINIAHF